jgi:FixJ family two-component response regulator
MTRVYIVDDDASVRNALKRLMKSVNIETEVFSEINGFLASDYKLKAHCLLLDVHIPGGSGFELKKRLDSSGSKVPVIFMTAHDNEETRRKAKNIGAFAYLQKPFEDNQLIKTINKAVRRQAS